MKKKWQTLSNASSLHCPCIPCPHLSPTPSGHPCSVNQGTCLQDIYWPGFNCRTFCWTLLPDDCLLWASLSNQGEKTPHISHHGTALCSVTLMDLGLQPTGPSLSAAPISSADPTMSCPQSHCAQAGSVTLALHGPVMDFLDVLVWLELKIETYLQTLETASLSLQKKKEFPKPTFSFPPYLLLFCCFVFSELQFYNLKTLN